MKTIGFGVLCMILGMTMGMFAQKNMTPPIQKFLGTLPADVQDCIQNSKEVASEVKEAASVGKAQGEKRAAVKAQGVKVDAIQAVPVQASPAIRAKGK